MLNAGDVFNAGTLFDSQVLLQSINESLQEEKEDSLLTEDELRSFLDPSKTLHEGWQDGTLFDKPMGPEKADGDIEYIPNPTPYAFHADTKSRVKALKSGVGMGKTSALAVELTRIAEQQAPDSKGVRYTKFAIIRSTYAQLKTTTLPTFLEWWPPQAVSITYGSPITVILRFRLPDGTTVHSQMLFFPLDRPAQVANLLSLEITGAAINEAAEIKVPGFIKVLLSRCRYPRADVAPITWKGVIMDYNPPPVDSWLWKMFEQNPDPRYRLYEFPPAVTIQRDSSDPEDPRLWRFEPNPDAENVHNVADGMNYWLELAEDYRYDWPMLQRFVLGDYTFGGAGRPVFSTFSERRHVLRDRTPFRTVPLVIGFDFGLYTAATIMQQQGSRLMVLDAMSKPESGLIEFLDDELMPLLNSKYVNIPRIATGDPSGGQRSVIDKQHCIMVLKRYGFKYVKPRFMNNAIAPRLESVNHFLRVEGAFGINERATELINALAGGYHWDSSREHLGIIGEKPVKDDSSHIADSCQYAAMYYYRGSGKMPHETDRSEYPSRQQHGPARATLKRPIDTRSRPRRHLYA